MLAYSFFISFLLIFFSFDFPKLYFSLFAEFIHRTLKKLSSLMSILPGPILKEIRINKDLRVRILENSLIYLF